MQNPIFDDRTIDPYDDNIEISQIDMSESMEHNFDAVYDLLKTMPNGKEKDKMTRLFIKEGRKIAVLVRTFYGVTPDEYYQKENCIEILSHVQEYVKRVNLDYTRQADDESKKEPLDYKRIFQLRDLAFDTGDQFNRIEMTKAWIENTDCKRYPEKYEKPEYMTPQQKHAEAYNAKAPDPDRVYLPALAYPMEPLPEDGSCPEFPKAWQVYANMDPREMDFDCEHNEYIFPEGFTEAKVIYDWDKWEVFCQYKDEPPEIWKFYRCKDTEDWYPDKLVEYYERVEKKRREAMGIHCFDLSEEEVKRKSELNNDDEDDGGENFKFLVKGKDDDFFKPV